MSFGYHNASSAALPDLAMRQVAQKGCEFCGRPRRPHTAYCGDGCRFWAKVRRGPNCWEWTGSRSGGRRGMRDYGQFSIGPREARTPIGAHVFSYQLHNGPVPEGMEIMHLCHNCLCVRPEHLAVGTHAENVRMSARAGRLSVPRPRRQKLSDEECADIVAYVRSHGRGASQEMAHRYGVSTTFVSLLVQGKRRGRSIPLVQKAS